MMKPTKRNNRPNDRPYFALRPNNSRVTPVRTGSVSPRQNPAGAAVQRLLGRLRRLPPPQIALICLVAVVCVCVTVVLAVSGSPRPKPTSLHVQVINGTSSQPTGADSLVSASTSSSATTPPPDPSNTIIRMGMTAPVVSEIQTRLMDLGYMDEDEPTEYFGAVTSSAISLFQRQHQLTADGTVGAETYNLLMSDEAQTYTVMQGASGEDVKQLQNRLRDLGYLEQATGNFGEQTTKAVKNFQKYNNLTSDGKVGQKTRELIYSAEAKAYFLKFGEQSDKVKSYQKRLKTLGYLTGEPDGKYGNGTVAAVKRFQEVNGLIADGFLGPKAVDLLMSKSAHANALVLGMRGKDVENMQRRLKALGYISHVTGYFGSETEDGVKAFQKRNGLTSDGMVGMQTLNKLNSSGAKKAASGSSGHSGGSSGGSSSSNLSGVEKLISIAQSKLGKKYVWGAKGPNTFDCSGFVYYCLNEAGVRTGYLTSAGWASSGRFQRITSIGDLRRGDILVFKGGSAGHVGIYLGNGSMIDASSANGKVIKRSGMWNIDYWKKEFICGYRVF